MPYLGTDVITVNKYADLLWTNPNPTTSFAPQTISLDLSDYRGVLIISKTNKDNNYDFAPREVNLFKVGSCGGLSYAFSKDEAIPDERGFTRNCKVTNAGIEFGNGYGGYGVNNETLIPLYIFGIKYFMGIDDYIMGTEV